MASFVVMVPEWQNNDVQHKNAMQLWVVIEFGRIWESPIFYPMPGPVDQPQPGLSPLSTDFSPDAPWHSGASPDQIV